MKKIGFIVGISFLAGALFFALTFGYFQKPENNKPILSQDEVQAETIKITGLNFAPLVKRVRPAVVKVISESVIEQRRSIIGDDFIDRFFNMPRGPKRVEGIGSGFIISKDGYIITNNHVVSKALKVRIETIDKKEYIAKIIGKDPKTDIALLKVKAKDLPFIELGDSNKCEIGEWVLAIGNPFYQDLSVTAGIISAKGRHLGAADYEDFIQTDAAINRGNSGGPLINTNGKVIGITSIIIAPGGGSVGIGFAIPSNLANKVIKDLKKEGRVIRGSLGISIQKISDSFAKDFDLSHGGTLIKKVDKNSPADKAGLKRYDLIIKMNGKKIKRMHSFRMKIAETKPGEVVDLTVLRGNKEMNIKVTIGEAPDTIKYRTQGKDSRSFDLGMILIDNDRSLADEYDLSTTKGVYVKILERNSLAAGSGIRRGDVILAVNRTIIKSVKQFKKIVSSKRPGSRVLLYINRRGEEGDLILKLPE